MTTDGQGNDFAKVQMINAYYGIPSDWPVYRASKYDSAGNLLKQPDTWDEAAIAQAKAAIAEIKDAMTSGMLLCRVDETK
jgi:hypothetical protein